MESNFSKNDYEEQIELPPGFRFHPTDDELIIHYLYKKVFDASFVSQAIGDVDLNKFEPWDLPLRAKFGEKSWYFFCVRDRKYPTGMRTNRATKMGYWKATGKDKEIYKAKTLIGMKKTLVFYKGRAPKGEKTNWIMHEFRLEGKLAFENLSNSTKGEWVISKVFEKNCGGKKIPVSGVLSMNYDCYLDELDSSNLPQLMDISSSKSETILDAIQENKPKTEDLIEGFNKSIEYTSSVNNNPFLFPNAQMIQNVEYLQYQDPSVLRFLMNDVSSINIRQIPNIQFENDQNYAMDSVGVENGYCLGNY